MTNVYDRLNSLLRLGRSSKLRVVLQSEAAECGLACLAMMSQEFGHDIDMPTMRTRFSASLKGMTLVQLIQVAHSLGMDARAIKVDLNYLTKVHAPCILHWDLNHFVVLASNNKNRLEILDPANGVRNISIEQAGEHFTGVVLELRPKPDFLPIKQRRNISFRALFGRVTGLPQVLLQIAGLAIVVELLGLIIPFQLQWTIDQILVTVDVSLLSIITVGFFAIALLQCGLSIARAWIISWFSATLEAQWSVNLFSHLMRLPIPYFSKRHMGDIVSRFGSLRTIQSTLTGSFLETLIDGLLGVLTLVVLVAYSVPLAGLAVFFLAVYGCLRWAMFRSLRRLNEEKLVHAAKQQTQLMESIRGITPIKLANKEPERRAKLENAVVETSVREVGIQRITMIFNSLSKGVAAAQRVSIISAGAFLVMRGNFTAGMLIAFLAYVEQFSQKSSSFIDRVVDLRMLYLHGERIADIALEPPEACVEGTYSGPDPMPRINLQGVSFRYSNDEPLILEKVNFTISEGECVGIYGPSGSGKTTLIKVILGLFPPTAGRITIGGIDIREFGIRRYRQMLAAVTQDDQLFAGSIAQNITFFNDSFLQDEVIQAAKSAAIHEEIVAMPMGYETLVGDMGSVLSGGQKQRLLLARALFKKPCILILDEATSHLDAENARKIDRAIRDLRITRIVISHNSETIARTDRAVSLVEMKNQCVRDSAA